MDKDWLDHRKQQAALQMAEILREQGTPPLHEELHSFVAFLKERGELALATRLLAMDAALNRT